VIQFGGADVNKKIAEFSSGAECCDGLRAGTTLIASRCEAQKKVGQRYFFGPLIRIDRKFFIENRLRDNSCALFASSSN
jgi:hypothetical protein